MDLDSYISENLALRRKLESKAQALSILTQELTKCRKERDELKLYSLSYKTHSKEFITTDRNEFVDSDSFEALKVKNKALLIEINDLRQKLEEAYLDMKVLRTGRSAPCEVKVSSWHQREELLQEVEESKAEMRQLKTDLQAVLDEKEELVTERDAYRCKVHRLNHEVARLLNSPSTIDIDAILMESKYLKERIDQMSSEIDMAKQTVAKYKGMLDKKRNEGNMKFGSASGEEPGGRVVTHKEVQELLSERDEPLWRWGLSREATVTELRGLCMALVEALQDKSTSLAHQRKANRMLAERVGVVEERLAKLEPLSPSQALLEGYTTAGLTSVEVLSPHNDNSYSSEFTEKGKEEAYKEDINEYYKTETESSNDLTERLPKELEDLVNKALAEVESGC